MKYWFRRPVFSSTTDDEFKLQIYMIEIYMYVSMAPIPFATFGNRDQSTMGMNYVKSLFALGFQGRYGRYCY